jgi:Cu/Ag efflux protein CusF
MAQRHLEQRQAPADAAKPTGQTKAVVHQAVGEIESMDPANTTVMLKHEAIASLKWPAMSMEFKLANAALVQGLKTGQGVDFEFVERAPGEYVITGMKALQKRAQATPSNSHSAH